MRTAKITISMDQQYLTRLDHFIKKKTFKNRSHAIQTAVIQELELLEHNRLAEECSKLNIHEERELAEENLLEDFKEWPKY